MTVCENKASRSLNFSTTNLCCTYRDVWILPVVFRHCVILPSFSASRPCFTPRCSVNTIDRIGKQAHESLICFSVSAWMELNYCYFAEVIHQHLPLLFFFFFLDSLPKGGNTTENLTSVYLICLSSDDTAQSSEWAIRIFFLKDRFFAVSPSGSEGKKMLNWFWWAQPLSSPTLAPFLYFHLSDLFQLKHVFASLFGRYTWLFFPFHSSPTQKRQLWFLSCVM